MPYADPEKRKSNNRKLNKDYYARIRAQQTPRYLKMIEEQRSKASERWTNLTQEERAAESAKRADRHFRRKFGLSLDKYESMLTKQGGVCAICRGTQRDHRRLAVDHDHASGEVRALLCTPCNSVLGYMRDDIELLQAAIRYLRHHKARSAPSSNG